MILTVDYLSILVVIVTSARTTKENNHCYTVENKKNILFPNSFRITKI